MADMIPESFYGDPHETMNKLLAERTQLIDTNCELVEMLERCAALLEPHSIAREAKALVARAKEG
jgi:hypothetical protein